MTNRISKSLDRNTFQLENYLKRCKETNQAPCEEYIDAVESTNRLRIENENDKEWAKNNLEYDLRTTDWILEKVRSSDDYARALYAALCNNDFVKRDIWQLLKEDKWGCSWRYAGGIIADMRETGDYIDWYCSGGEGDVSEEIDKDLRKLGWIVVSFNG
jgi:hypothetical protein